jgi:hypothetical protein
VEKLRLELTSLVGGDGDDFRPAGKTVDCSEVVYVARRHRKQPHKVYVDMQETYRRLDTHNNVNV